MLKFTQAVPIALVAVVYSIFPAAGQEGAMAFCRVDKRYDPDGTENRD
ncbi:MAG: hypothetical protein U0935_17995 [Pirellulales bacterium]